MTPPQTLRVRNWDKWQSYRRDRGQPPWIKVHRCVMRDPNWVALTDAQRGQLVAIWLLAADHDGAIPASPTVVRKLCYLDSEPDFFFFMEQGFIEHDANVTPPRRQRDATETETETETEYRSDTDVSELVQKRVLDTGVNVQFEQFWTRYPRRAARKRAESAFRNLPKSDRQAAITGLETFDFDSDPRLVPHPATWLNGRRWEDEPLPPRRLSNGDGRRTTADMVRDADEAAARAERGEAAAGHDPALAAHGGVVRRG